MYYVSALSAAKYIYLFLYFPLLFILCFSLIAVSRFTDLTATMSTFIITRQHSSRIRTVLFNGHLYRRGVCPGRCVQGVCVSRGVCLGGVCLGGVHPLPTACWEMPPTHCGQTDTCENITLPKTSFAGGNKTASQ